MSYTKILITGAAGFIGSHLVDYLLEKKIPVSSLRLFIKLGNSLENLPNKQFDIVYGDIRDKSIVKKAMRGVQTVYHLAAKIDFDGRKYSEYEDINVEGTQNLLDACKGKSIKKFVFFSSIGVYGLPAGVGNIINYDESHRPTYSNFYGRSKWEAEERVRKAHQEFDLPYTIVRPASVYGPREKGPTLALYQAVKNKRFMMIGDGLNKMHYVYVRDLVEGAYLAVTSKKKNGEYILAGAKPTMFRDIVKEIASSISVESSFVTLPKSLALLMSYVLEFFGKLVGFKPPLFPSRVRTMTSSYYYNINRAKKQIHYRPRVDFAKGATLTGKWYLENNWL